MLTGLGCLGRKIVCGRIGWEAPGFLWPRGMIRIKKIPDRISQIFEDAGVSGGATREIRVEYCKQRACAQSIERWGVAEIELGCVGSRTEFLRAKTAEKHTAISLLQVGKVGCHWWRVEKCTGPLPTKAEFCVH